MIFPQHQHTWLVGNQYQRYGQHFLIVQTYSRVIFGTMPTLIQSTLLQFDKLTLFLMKICNPGILEIIAVSILGKVVLLYATDDSSTSDNIMIL